MYHNHIHYPPLLPFQHQPCSRSTHEGFPKSSLPQGMGWPHLSNNMQPPTFFSPIQPAAYPNPNIFAIQAQALGNQQEVFQAGQQQLLPTLVRLTLTHGEISAIEIAVEVDSQPSYQNFSDFLKNGYSSDYAKLTKAHWSNQLSKMIVSGGTAVCPNMLTEKLQAIFQNIRELALDNDWEIQNNLNQHPWLQTLDAIQSIITLPSNEPLINLSVEDGLDTEKLKKAITQQEFLNLIKQALEPINNIQRDELWKELQTLKINLVNHSEFLANTSNMPDQNLLSHITKNSKAAIAAMVFNLITLLGLFNVGSVQRNQIIEHEINNQSPLSAAYKAIRLLSFNIHGFTKYDVEVQSTVLPLNHSINSMQPHLAIPITLTGRALLAFESINGYNESNITTGTVVLNCPPELLAGLTLEEQQEKIKNAWLNPANILSKVPHNRRFI